MKKALCLWLLFCTACTHSVHLVDAQGFGLKAAKKAPHLVRVQAEQEVILGFVFDTHDLGEAQER